MVGTNPKIRVLVADDQMVVRDGLILLLEPYADLEIVGTASNGRDAVDLTKSLDPDVVIMDFHMSVMDGPNATREIRSTQPDTYLIIMSGYQIDGDAERAAAAGADAYLLKDAPIEELVKIIREIRAGEADPNRPI